MISLRASELVANTYYIKPTRIEQLLEFIKGWPRFPNLRAGGVTFSRGTKTAFMLLALDLDQSIISSARWRADKAPGDFSAITWRG